MNQANFEKAMNAALRGPEVKKLKFEKHEFNVKPAKIERKDARLHVSGQISHHLAWRDDDQFYYRFAVASGQQVSIQDIDVDIDESILSKVFKLGLDLLVEFLKEQLEDEFDGQTGQTEQALTSSGDQASARVFEESKRLLDGSWQGEANVMVVNIAARVGLGVAAQRRTKVDPLVFARRLNITRPVRKRPVVRDHRTTARRALD